MRVPLAWRNLTHHKRRLGLALAGISFVVLLMFMEIGFFNGMLDNEGLLYERFNADLVLVSAARTPDHPHRFPRERLYQTRACPAVVAAVPLYTQYAAEWRLPATGDTRTIRVIGFDARTEAIRGLEPDLRTVLRKPGTVLFDREARPVYGATTVGSVVAVGGRDVRIGGLFSLGVTLDTDGTLLMDESTYFALFGDAAGGADPERVDYALVRLRPGSDVQEAVAQLRHGLSEDVRVLALPDYIAWVKQYWRTNSPVGFLFGIGVLVGLLIGVIVCYQILYADIAANLMPFATLKGIGYHNRYLVRVVLQQASLLALLGFAGGLLATVLLYRFLEWSTGLVMILTVFRVALILVLTLVMCLIAGLMALGTVIKADPADCF